MYRFLIVDDNHDEALQISYLIGTDFSKEAECEFATSRAEALSWLNPNKHKPIDGILLDLNLPDSRGVETYRAVRAAAPHVPILVWSGRNDERGLRDLLIDEGAAGYLEKGNVTYKQIFEDLRDAARRAKTCMRMALEDKQLLEETERRGAAYVETVRSSNPPKSEAAHAAALQGLIRLHVAQSKQTARMSEKLEKVGYITAQLERLEERDREHDAKHAEAAQRLDEAEATGRYTAQNVETVKWATERNKKILKRIAIALAAIAYTLNEGGDLVDKVLPLLGFGP